MLLLTKFIVAYQPYNQYSTVGGGGFENSESRPNSGESSGSNNRSHTLTPVTIKQILESQQQVQDGPFVMHNQELHRVCFVGVVRNITDNTSNINVTVEDGTGQVDIKKWSEDANDMAMSQEGKGSKNSSQVAQQYHVGGYVKVFGALQEFGGKRYVQYAVIKNIASFNDVLAHHLEAIKCYAIANGKLAGSSVEKNEGEDGGRSLFVKDAETNDSGNPLQKILAYCRKQCEGKDANSFAVPIPLISQSLNVDENTARDCCTTLTEQGFIYPTFDDNHFFAL